MVPCAVRGCEPRAQGRSGPGERDGDTATGCERARAGRVCAQVYTSAWKSRAGLEFPTVLGDGKGTRDMTSAAHACLCGLSIAVSLRDTSRTQEWKNVLCFRTFFI